MLRSIIKKHWILTLLILGYLVYFTIYSLLRYKYFYTGIFDIGNMNQTLWNTLHGHFFMETDPAGSGRLVSRLSDHADFFLLLLLPLYALFPNVSLLLVVQTVIVALGAIPVYLFTKEKTDSMFYPLFFACLYLLMPSVENPNLFEFHAVTVSMTFILFSFYFLYKKKFRLAVPFIFLSLLTKEEVGFTISFMLLYFFFCNISIKKNPFYAIKNGKNSLLMYKERFLQRKKENITLLGFAFGAVFYSTILITVVIPYFRGGPSLYLHNYMGSSQNISGIVLASIFNPLKLIKDQFGYAAKYTIDLTMPLGGLSFFSPLMLLIALPEWAIDVFSANHYMQSIFFQYPSVINPFIILSGISGFMSVNNFFQRRIHFFKPYYLVIGVIVSSLISAYLSGPLPLAQHYLSPDILKSNITKKDTAEIAELSHELSNSVSITADNNLGSHFSSRPYIYAFPTDIDTADYVIVREPYTDSADHLVQIYAGDSVYVYKKV